MPWLTNLESGVIIFTSSDDFPKCEICGSQLPGSLRWGIVNGVATCRCGAQYCCLLRGPDGKVVAKEPQCLTEPALIPEYKAAWESSKSTGVFQIKAKAITARWDEKHG